MRIYEITVKPKPPLSPDQARIEALKNQAKRSQAAVKAERARQRLSAAQKALTKANTSIPEQSSIVTLEILRETYLLKKFQAQVKLKNGCHSYSVVTEVNAINYHQAKILLAFLFGKGNILFVKALK
jgi:hypothetical protein